MKNKLNDMQIKCASCDKTVTLEAMKSHVLSCGNLTVSKCPYDCNSTGIAVEALGPHLMFDCPNFGPLTEIKLEKEQLDN